MPPAKKRRIAAEIAAAKNTLVQQDQNTSHEITSNINDDPVDPIMSELQRLHRETMDNLLNDLHLLQNSSSGKEREELILSISVALSTLKMLQRQISLRVERHYAAISKEERGKVESCSLMLQNLKYEKNYLQREIEDLRGWKADELEKMACEELGLDASTLETEPKSNDGDDVRMTDADKRITTREEAIDAYIFGEEESSKQSYRDPCNHERILAKLQNDAAARSSLVDQLSRSKLELKELQRKREELRSFLARIPKKLREMEKVGESLSGFFAGCRGEWFSEYTQDERGASTSLVVEKQIKVANSLVCSPSLERTQRFQLAQSNLASPLYVLFVQLSGYIDAWSTVDRLEDAEKKSYNLEEFVGAGGMDVAAVPVTSSGAGSGEEGKSCNRWNVVLTIPTVNLLPAEISSLLGRTIRAGGECIKIVFSYDSDQAVVRAGIASENNAAHEDDLLDNLFPGDDGLVCPNVPLALLKPQEEEVDSDDAISSSKSDTCDANSHNQRLGKPYHWCQVLSGLNFSPPSSRESNGTPFQINVCTKAVFRQLLRRIRARRSLSALLDFLGKRGQISNLPIHPAFRSDESAHSQQCKAKVVSWLEEKENSSNVVSYPPTMKRYVATIKRKSCTLKAIVVIDTQNYPAEPPIWSLQNEDGSLTGSASSWGEQHGNLSSLQESNTNHGGRAPPLFDAALHRIETHVNTDLDQFVSQGVESTYDWIVLHQLVDIVSCWDELMSLGEGNGGMGTRGNEDTRRLRRGKDRRLVGFGEQSPFFYYRNGL